MIIAIVAILQLNTELKLSSALLVRLNQHLCSANTEGPDQDETMCTEVVDISYGRSCIDKGYVEHLSVLSIFFVLLRKNIPPHVVYCMS